MAAAIEHALRLEPEARDALARRARAHIAQGFTREAMCARTIAIYEELLFPEPEMIPTAEPLAISA
jgi:glycosyltransferase involved in cell wall biosynthesis